MIALKEVVKKTEREKKKMTKEKFMEIFNEHKMECTVITGQDVYNAMSFVRDLLSAEAGHIQNTEPYATKTIERYNVAAHTIDSLNFDIWEYVEEIETNEQ